MATTAEREQWQRGRGTTVDPQITEEGRVGSVLGARDSPEVCGADHGEVSVPLQPVEVHGGAWRRSQSRCMPEAAAILLETHTGAGSWKNLWNHGKSSPHWSRSAGRTFDPTVDPCFSSLFFKDCILWKGPMLEFVKTCSSWEGLILEKFMEDCCLWEGSHGGAGEECESSSWGGRNSKD